MSIALIALAFGCLIAGVVLWQRNKRFIAAGAVVSVRSRVAIVVLAIGAAVLALLSQLVR